MQLRIEWRPRRSDAPAVEILDGVARLFEQTDYVLLVESLSEARVRVRHRDPLLVRGLHVLGGGRLVHGVVNFGAQIGRSRFVVEVDGRPYRSLDVEVFPSKLDYRDDYAALRADVQDVAAGLALAYLRGTEQPAAAEILAVSSTPAWVLLLREGIEALEAALAYVARRPLRGTERAEAPVRAERVRTADAALRRALLQSEGRSPSVPSRLGFAVPRRLPAPQRRYTLDTPEHRWLAARLTGLHRALTRVLESESALPPTPRRARTMEELEALRARVVGLQRRGPWAEIAAGGLASASPTFRMLSAPGYREAHRAFRVLRQGLAVGHGPVPAGVKDLHVLYEYWCVLAVARRLALRCGGAWPAGELLRVDARGLCVRLRRGRAQTLVFDRADGTQARLVYNPRFAGAGYLVPQRPDLVLTVRHPGGEAAAYVLDAKYRLDASPAYRRRYGVPGPPQDALNDLHRYRDAVRVRVAGRRVAVRQAVALYPYRPASDAAFAESRLGRALAEVGVGALPLLPGPTPALDAWIDGVLTS